jgi:hypothetical protein
MVGIDASIVSDQREPGQQDDGLSQHNPSPNAEIVRRGQEAMDRKRRDRRGALARPHRNHAGGAHQRAEGQAL